MPSNATNPGSIAIRRVGGRIGALATGIDLAQPLDESAASAR
ncbi:MAG: hypothetical protein AB7L84_00540 [Acidimicrobiia bacterium]